MHLFRSFWIAGFESATHITDCSERLDMIAATQHDRLVSDDYARLLPLGFRTVRDTMRWHLIEARRGRFDFSSVAPFVEAARARGIQVIWDLLHYGTPCGVELFSPDFPQRFADFAHAAATWLSRNTDEVPLFTPINELSFFSWAAGEVGWFYPHGRGRGLELKRQLVRGWVCAVDAIRDVDARARVVSVEPLIHNVPPLGLEDVEGRAAAQRRSQWEAWDMIAGLRDADLGGRPDLLDVMGVNFYHDNQWEVPGGEKIAWHVRPRDSRWIPFHRLLREAWDRYQRPIFVGETSHVGVGRADWLREMTDEVCLALREGVTVEGVCLYPIIDRFEWDDPGHWHNSGLWDLARTPDGTLQRVLCLPYAAELVRCQARLAATLADCAGARVLAQVE
jgi:beta-glucosidase/6-phospho-beta-glucosidase/beta-galactosidase